MNTPKTDTYTLNRPQSKTNGTPSRLPKNFIEDLKKQKTSTTTTRSNKLPEETADNIIEAIRKHYNFESKYDALSVLALLLHTGGTARQADGNMTATYKGQVVKLAIIRNILTEFECKNGMRKLARCYASVLWEIQVALERPGNLYPKIHRLYPDQEFTVEEKCWLSDFQASNDECPANMRSLIAKSFNKKTKKK